MPPVVIKELAGIVVSRMELAVRSKRMGIIMEAIIMMAVEAETNKALAGRKANKAQARAGFNKALPGTEFPSILRFKRWISFCQSIAKLCASHPKTAWVVAYGTV
jgi:hypothetical protein